MSDGQPGRAYRLAIAGPAARALAERVPEAVAAAVADLMDGDLIEAPRRVGKPLQGAYDGFWVARRGTYRVIYRIDDANATVTVVAVWHRGDVYRPR